MYFLTFLFRTRTRGEQFLVRWAVPQLHDIDALSGMVDPSLNGEYPAKSLSHFADIILRCVQVSFITLYNVNCLSLSVSFFKNT